MKLSNLEAKSTQLTSTNKDHLINRRIRESLLIILLLLNSYLIISLLTYTSLDTGWSYVSINKTIHNYGGKAGAWIADVLLTLLGFAAWIIPIAFFSMIFHIMKYRSKNTLWPYTWILRSSIGFALLMLGGMGLLSLYDQFYHYFDYLLPSGSGGIIGQILSHQALLLLGISGSILFFFALLFISSICCTRLSWFNVFELTGRISYRTVLWLLSLVKKISKGLYPILVGLSHTILKQKYRYNTKSTPPTLDDNVIKNETIKKKVVLTVEDKNQLLKTIESADSLVSIKENNTKNYPNIDLLNNGAIHDEPINDKASEKIIGQELVQKLKEFNIDITVVAILSGPVITRYEIAPSAGIKACKISALAQDLARSLAVTSVRVVEVIPGKTVIGVEIPNSYRNTVYLRSLIASQVFHAASSPLSLALGHDIAGQPIIVDLAKMPHLLVAGTTGSGKSVGINAMLLSLLFKSDPEIVRLIMIDPKMLELSVYEGIPHLLTPVVTDMKEAASALRWCVSEMECRYTLMAELGVRNLESYNNKIKVSQSTYTPLPFIVIVIDEFADMMMIVGKKVEELIARIAQKARAAGIHLILATQRPSVDVITGLIKANIPTRISFQVSSKIDSRTILDQSGAEQLLGNGDMLYLPAGASIPIRIHGALVDDDEVHRVVAHWKQGEEPKYIEDIVNCTTLKETDTSFNTNEEADPLYDEAVTFVTQTQKASISSLQRQFRIGYNRAARIIEFMESANIISSLASNGTREVFIPRPNLNDN